MRDLCYDIDMKICKKCGNNRKNSSFYKSNNSTCKYCIIEYNKKYQDSYRVQKKESIKAYRTKYRADNKDKLSEYYREWYSKNGRKRSSVYVEKITEWQENNPEKKAAAYAVNLEVSRGNIVRPTICSACGEKRKVVGHHYDYERPLDVVWLCYSCHKFEHNKTK